MRVMKDVNMKIKHWLISYFIIILAGLGCIGGMVAWIDPLFHYHRPLDQTFSYVLNNQRYQNDGILKHFDYDAVITGTSMVENFLTSELDALFDVHSVKIPYVGASFREVNEGLETALKTHPDTRMVVRCLDMNKFMDDKDELRDDLGEYPTYLYNRNPLDDVRYLFNRNVIFDRCLPMIAGWLKGEPAGVTDFDHYGYWMYKYYGKFGPKYVLEEMDPIEETVQDSHLSEETRAVIEDNIQQNVVALARQYPDVTFYIYLAPYSAAWWGRIYSRGTIFRQTEAEQFVIEQLLECENIRVYSFNTMIEMTSDLNNYKDTRHYGETISSSILRWMKEGTGLLTQENYLDYIEKERQIYTSYDYSTLFEQEDLPDPRPKLKDPPPAELD